MGRAAWVAAVVVLACAGCDASPGATSTPSAAVTPSPAIDLGTSAAVAYAAALAERTREMATLDAQCAVASSTSALQECWSSRWQVQSRYNRAFDAITFPAKASAEVAALRSIDGRLAAAMEGLSSAADPRADPADDGIVAGESAYFLAGSVTLRRQLGIPDSPSQ